MFLVQGDCFNIDYLWPQNQCHYDHDGLLQQILEKRLISATNHAKCSQTLSPFSREYKFDIKECHPSETPCLITLKYSLIQSL